MVLSQNQSQNLIIRILLLAVIFRFVVSIRVNENVQDLTSLPYTQHIAMDQIYEHIFTNHNLTVCVINIEISLICNILLFAFKPELNRCREDGNLLLFLCLLLNMRSFNIHYVCQYKRIKSPLINDELWMFIKIPILFRMKNIYIVGALAISVIFILSSYQGNLPQKTLKTEYLTYLHKFGKDVPSPSEFEFRLRIFELTIKEIQKHNSDSTHTWKMAVNQFADLTQQEFANTYLGETAPHAPYTIVQEINAGFEGDIDWRDSGIITAVKNQGQCGSCWAFAATAAHESYQVQVHGKEATISLSEQQLVDCSEEYGNNGCNGGLGSRGLQYIKDLGQTTTEAYPYVAKNQECQKETGEFHIFGVSQITSCQNMEIVIQQRPMAVRVDATNWHLYGSGIFDNCDTKLNHAVFLVGSSTQAWTIKNSWSTTWGEKGFIRLKKGNTCGVCIGPSFPI